MMLSLRMRSSGKRMLPPIPIPPWESQKRRRHCARKNHELMECSKSDQQIIFRPRKIAETYADEKRGERERLLPEQQQLLVLQPPAAPPPVVVVVVVNSIRSSSQFPLRPSGALGVYCSLHSYAKLNGSTLT